MKILLFVTMATYFPLQFNDVHKHEAKGAMSIFQNLIDQNFHIISKYVSIIRYKDIRIQRALERFARIVE